MSDCLLLAATASWAVLAYAALARLARLASTPMANRRDCGSNSNIEFESNAPAACLFSRPPIDPVDFESRQLFRESAERSAISAALVFCSSSACSPAWLTFESSAAARSSSLMRGRSGCGPDSVGARGRFRSSSLITLDGSRTRMPGGARGFSRAGLARAGFGVGLGDIASFDGLRPSAKAAEALADFLARSLCRAAAASSAKFSLVA